MPRVRLPNISSALAAFSIAVLLTSSQLVFAQSELYWYYWTQQAVAGANKDQKSRVKVMLENASDRLNDYYLQNKSLPRFDPDMDTFMTKSYKSIMSSPADANWTPSASGSQRAFGDVRMLYDARAGNLTKINDKYELPSDWTGDVNKLVIVTDGQDEAVAYFTGVDGKPTAFMIIDCTPGVDDDPAASSN